MYQPQNNVTTKVINDSGDESMKHSLGKYELRWDDVAKNSNYNKYMKR